MPFYDFQAINKKNETVTGIVEATDEVAALKLVQEEGLTPVKIEEKSGSALQMQITLFQRVKIKDVVIMSRQLAVMMEADLPLVDALKILMKQTSNPKLQSILKEVTEDVDGGGRLSQSFKKFPKVFSEFYISIIKSGETSGKLDEVFNYLADQLEKDYDQRAKIKGAMIYPVFILCGLVVVGVLMMIFVVPKMTSILTESGVELPLTTKMLIATSGFMQNFWWLLLLLAAGMGLVIYYGFRNKQFKYYFDWLKLHLPVFGGLFQRIYIVRMTQSLATLSAGKVPLTDSLAIVQGVVGNEVYRRTIEQTIIEVKDGNSIATIFQKSKEVPSMVTQMLTVGEETGRLEDVLIRLTDFYTREIDNSIANLVTLIEPLVMIFMGLAVGVMVAAIIMPIYTLSTGI